MQLSLSTAKSVLCLGAHSDDIEIGCGGTLLALLASNPSLEVHWVVFSAAGNRGAEARASFESWCQASPNCKLYLYEFEDTLFPVQLASLKKTLANLATQLTPDVIFTHRLKDAHQDHRTVGEITWNAFRNHWILEYEIPKYEGDLGRPNIYVPLPKECAERKLQLLMTQFESQQAKPWYMEQTFRSLMHLRSIECRAESGYAEAFHSQKQVLSI